MLVYKWDYFTKSLCIFIYCFWCFSWIMSFK